LIEDAVTMFLAHCDSNRPTRRATPRLSRTGGARS
jgi:hypothetical protein